MRFPKFGLFARASKPITRSVSPNSAAADRSKRGRHSKPSTTTKRKRSITYMANKSQRFYPSDLFPVPPPSSSMPLTNYNHSSNVTGLVPATSHHASVPVRANVGGERQRFVVAAAVTAIDVAIHAVTWPLPAASDHRANKQRGVH